MTRRETLKDRIIIFLISLKERNLMLSFWSKVLSWCFNCSAQVFFCECTHFEEKFSLDAPILSVDTWEIRKQSPPNPPTTATRRRRRTTLSSPWSVGCSADKKDLLSFFTDFRWNRYLPITRKRMARGWTGPPCRPRDSLWGAYMSARKR